MSQIWFPAVPFSGNNLGQVVHLHTHVVCHQTVYFFTSLRVVMPCSWEGNHMASNWSTQPSTLHGTVKWVSAFGLSNNKMAMVDVDGGWLTVQVGWLGPSVGGRLAHQSAFTRWTLSMLDHINFILVIIILKWFIHLWVQGREMCTLLTLGVWCVVLYLALDCTMQSGTTGRLHGNDLTLHCNLITY